VTKKLQKKIKPNYTIKMTKKNGKQLIIKHITAVNTNLPKQEPSTSWHLNDTI